MNSVHPFAPSMSARPSVVGQPRVQPAAPVLSVAPEGDTVQFSGVGKNLLITSALAGAAMGAVAGPLRLVDASYSPLHNFVKQHETLNQTSSRSVLQQDADGQWVLASDTREQYQQLVRTLFEDVITRGNAAVVDADDLWNKVSDITGRDLKKPEHQQLLQEAIEKAKALDLNHRGLTDNTAAQAEVLVADVLDRAFELSPDLQKDLAEAGLDREQVLDLASTEIRAVLKKHNDDQFKGRLFLGVAVGLLVSFLLTSGLGASRREEGEAGTVEKKEPQQ